MRFSPSSNPDTRYSAISGIQEHDNMIALRFITGSGASISEKMRITSQGKIGIGTDNPNGKFEILQSSEGSNVNLLTLSNPFQTANTEVSLRFSPSSSPDSRYSAISGIQEGNNMIALRFLTGSGVDITEKLRITSLGKIGVGTQTPNCKFEILQESEGANVNLLTLSNPFQTPNTEVSLRFSPSSIPDSRYSAISGIQEGNNMVAIRFLTGSGPDISEKVRITSLGKVGIGTDNPLAKLDVRGTIRADEVLVNLEHGADFVFSPEYKLRSLKEVESFIKENQHLPEIAPAKDMEANGVNVSEMQMKMLQKMEEMTLYIIEMNKRMEILENENIELKKLIK